MCLSRNHLPAQTDQSANYAHSQACNAPALVEDSLVSHVPIRVERLEHPRIRLCCTVRANAYRVITFLVLWKSAILA